MKRIGIDARLYFQTGVGVYLRNFLYYLQNEALEDYEFYVYVLEKDSDQITFINPRFIKREVHSKWHSFSEQLVFNRVLMKDHLDLMHFTYFSYPVMYSRPFIATIHDVTPLIFKTGRASTLPQFVYDFKHDIFKFVLSQQVKNSKRIITPTHAVKNKLIEIYGKKYEDKITVLYEGVNYEFFSAKENSELKKSFQQDFFLYVGNFYPHKNVDRLLQSFEHLNRKDIDLVLAGPSNYFSGKIEQYIIDNNLHNIKMYHPSHADDLLFLYKNCKALINPSLSEGFGLPIVEAAYCGTSIIASDIDVFKEILGDNYLSFDPMDTEKMTETLQLFLSENNHIKPLLQDIFSFEHMVKEYIHLLNEID